MPDHEKVGGVAKDGQELRFDLIVLHEAKRQTAQQAQVEIEQSS
ncbi:hypothetical protein [Deinococcus multiflagellatus]|uniref:Uncharacterized protein n=1 Tax=Deinococcus multiflagellatus TaxID=1656887 RepID=A0ABW1ZNH4_9DEIO